MGRELIDEIKNSLRTHEEAYTPGAWELFDAQNSKKPRFLYWPLWSVASIALIIGGLFYLNNNENTVVHSTKNIVNTKPAIQDKAKQNNISNEKLETLKAEFNDPILNQNTKPNLPSTPQTTISYPLDHKNRLVTKNTLQTEKLKIDIINKQEQQIGVTPEAIINKLEKKHEEVIAKNENPVNQKPTFEQLLATDSKNNKLTKTDENRQLSKWEQDIFVAPSMGNDSKLNMNYGFTLSYNIAKKLAVSSGIAYTALSTKSNNSSAPNAPMNAPSTISALSANTKNLESVDARLSGINIPLDLKYHISDKLYTSVGISAFATIKTKQENNYLVSQAKNTSVVNTLGIAEQKMLVVTDRVSEQQTENEVVSDKYLGFYNFSLGYKQKISSKKNIAIEPFLSVPMKSFSKENLNLTNGGLKLKFEF